VQVELTRDGQRMRFDPVPGTEKVFPADLVLLAMGFVGPERNSLVEGFGVELDERGNVKADRHTKRTSVPKVYTAGDMTRGQSLIVWAIAEGRHAAQAIDRDLMGSSDLPRPLEHENDLRPFAV
jgi:glutamate synthase (NADPH/NADH) small chain